MPLVGLGPFENHRVKGFTDQNVAPCVSGAQAELLYGMFRIPGINRGQPGLRYWGVTNCGKGSSNCVREVGVLQSVEQSVYPSRVKVGNHAIGTMEIIIVSPTAKQFFPLYESYGSSGLVSADESFPFQQIRHSGCRC